MGRPPLASIEDKLEAILKAEKIQGYCIFEDKKLRGCNDQLWETAGACLREKIMKNIDGKTLFFDILKKTSKLRQNYLTKKGISIEPARCEVFNLVLPGEIWEKIRPRWTVRENNQRKDFAFGRNYFDFIVDKLWETTKIECCFVVDRSYTYEDYVEKSQPFASIYGNCKDCNALFTVTVETDFQNQDGSMTLNLAITDR